MARGGDLFDRLQAHRLPPRHAPLLVIAPDPREAARHAAALRARGRPDARGLALDWAAVPAAELARGAGAARLWRPPPWLEEHVDLLPPPAAGPVVDLGCGSGRAAAWLAGRGHDVLAVDRHAEALAWARDLAADLAAPLRTLQVDLTAPGALPEGRWAAALALRFLHRPLLEALPASLQPGGVAVVRTFLWRDGHGGLPRRTYCLEPGELATLFREPEWDILALREDADPDGRPAAGVVARRRVGG